MDISDDTTQNAHDVGSVVLIVGDRTDSSDEQVNDDTKKRRCFRDEKQYTKKIKIY